MYIVIVIYTYTNSFIKLHMSMNRVGLNCGIDYLNE